MTLVSGETQKNTSDLAMGQGWKTWVFKKAKPGGFL